jgi:hypothetical protein
MDKIKKNANPTYRNTTLHQVSNNPTGKIPRE